MTNDAPLVASIADLTQEEIRAVGKAALDELRRILARKSEERRQARYTHAERTRES